MDTLIKYKLIVCLSLGVLLVASQVLSNEYINYKLYSDKVPKIINNYDVIKAYDDDNLLLVSNARGYYGVLTSSGREIISPVWNSVQVLSEDRFIVGKTDNLSTTVGILDSYENTIIPMLFSEITWQKGDFLVGTLIENDKKIVFNEDGNVGLYQEWDSFQTDGESATLLKDGNVATITHDDYGNLTYTSLTLPFKVFDKDFTTTVKNPLTDGISAYDDYSTIVKSLATYCEALFNSDTDMIRSVTNSQYYNSLISYMLPDCTFEDIKNLSIYGRQSEDFGVIYHANFDIVYSCMSTMLDDFNFDDDVYESSQMETTTLNLKLEFVRSDDGAIVLKSVDKTTQTNSNVEDIEADE